MVRMARTAHVGPGGQRMPMGPTTIYREDPGASYASRDTGLVGLVPDVLHRAGRPLTAREVCDRIEAAGGTLDRPAIRGRLSHLKKTGRIRRLPGWPVRWVPVGLPPAREGTS